MTQWGLDNLFNPGKRHMDDEKRRLQSTREEIGDASKGRRIDLEAGKVSITVRRTTDVAAEDVDDDTALAAALEAEDVPAVALANDEAEIVPAVVDDGDDGDDDSDDAGEPDHHDAEPTEVVAATVEADDETDDETDDGTGVADDAPIEAPAPAPVVATPRRRQLSASAWSRRG